MLNTHYLLAWKWWAHQFLAAASLLAFAFQVDWTLNIGEQALDICIFPLNQSASSVFVLGERNFFCLKDNGQIRFMKKLGYNPSCFLPYCSGGCGDFSVILSVSQDYTL
jgi:hypothetical protein